MNQPNKAPAIGPSHSPPKTMLSASRGLIQYDIATKYVTHIAYTSQQIAASGIDRHSPNLCHTNRGR